MNRWMKNGLILELVVSQFITQSLAGTQTFVFLIIFVSFEAGREDAAENWLVLLFSAIYYPALSHPLEIVRYCRTGKSSLTFS